MNSKAKRKLLLLGGSRQQVVAIDAAKAEGYFTILCDYLPDNPGQYHADKFYQESTTDKEHILQIAKAEQVEGIVAYASDPAAPTAAFVSEKLGLPGIPYKTAVTFCEKNLFRKFLNANGFCVPRFCEITAAEDFDNVKEIGLPVIIKPSDSSGSKGVSVVHNEQEYKAALSYADSISRNHV